jgi:hypothetical protein
VRSSSGIRGRSISGDGAREGPLQHVTFFTDDGVWRAAAETAGLAVERKTGLSATFVADHPRRWAFHEDPARSRGVPSALEPSRDQDDDDWGCVFDPPVRGFGFLLIDNDAVGREAFRVYDLLDNHLGELTRIPATPNFRSAFLGVISTAPIGRASFEEGATDGDHILVGTLWFASEKGGGPGDAGAAAPGVAGR